MRNKGNRGTPLQFFRQSMAMFTDGMLTQVREGKVQSHLTAPTDTYDKLGRVEAPSGHDGHFSSHPERSRVVETSPPLGDQDHRCLNGHVKPGLGCGRRSTTPRTVLGNDVRHRLHTGQFEGRTTRDVQARTRAVNQLSGLDARERLRSLCSRAHESWSHDSDGPESL